MRSPGPYSPTTTLLQLTYVMPIRARKFVGAILLLLLVAVWALLAMAVAQFVFTSSNNLAAWVYYVVVGIGWVLPAMPLISWMSRPDRAE